MTIRAAAGVACGDVPRLFNIAAFPVSRHGSGVPFIANQDMSTVELKGVGKRYDADHWALRGIDLQLQRGEFLALLGPSGCGKTTLLRLLAGFETPSEGEILFDGERVASPSLGLPPERRDVGVVFQSYALWPHMTVAENVGYPLKASGRKYSAGEARDIVAEALERMGLLQFSDRYPEALSGGQRQRVALARCLVQRPALALLDEPLASLDVHLRHEMMEMIQEFHQALGGTLVYVTHDQSEAMALADRIAVFSRGSLLQVDAPHTLYREPRGEAVARFLGRGRVVDVELTMPDGSSSPVARCAGGEFPVRIEPGAAPGPARALVRPDDVRLDPQGIKARVLRGRYLGGRHEIEFELLGAPGAKLLCEHVEDLGPGSLVGLSISDAWIVGAQASG